ncbi:MAG: cupin domain-containing protein [Anaerolineae bacterium]|jgi:mannose-6-phosphate isomerase-like protein (cupin superfamily)|nr:cupin domain-containing protein [Anaerolineae bacterium]MBT7483452.1 cupin domain-containing protein [Candidatus Peregrinibacteria bacterium]MBT3713415.1 cupin domain-containing protein [Anaerolineae bacterium]MBT4311817.1 cupin domain-containing protein [Anaerolineae bacterium]MBT4456677.1 cupin domain-containing protein [Anaerolineae bacterium]
MSKVNLKEKLTLFESYWDPKIVGELNDQYVKVAKLKGEFLWHHHENEDELFLVIKGQLLIKLRDDEIELNEGEFYIIPRGIEHMPVAEKEVHILLFEPKGTVNTGNADSKKTVHKLKRL